MAGTPSRPTPPPSGNISPKMSNQIPFKPASVPKGAESESKGDAYLSEGETSNGGRN